MSDPLVLEPQTNAKVILHTNFGPLELELFGGQCPLTVRSFLTHCLSAYYNNTIFHRLVPGFILQGGDPSNTGHGGDSIYPDGLPDEFHQRIKFNRRGMVGMANGGTRNDNGSQFFLTLGAARELDGRNTCFGRLVGDGIYNLVRMAEGGCAEGSERPELEVRVETTEVVVNPYDDIKAPEPKAPVVLPSAQSRKPTKKKPKGRQMLSFADAEEEQAPVLKKKKTFDTRLVVDAPAPPRQRSPTPPPSRTKSPTPPPTKKEPTPPPKRRRSPSPAVPAPPPSTAEQIRAVRAALSRRTPTPPPQTKPKTTSLLALQKQLLPATSTIGRKRRNKASPEDTDSFLALQRFQAKLNAQTPTSEEPADIKMRDDAKEAEEDEDALKECDLHFVPGCESCRKWELGEEEKEEDEGADDGRTGIWDHTLSFEKDRKGKDLMWKKKNEELVVIDPREKERELVGAKRGGRGGGRGGAMGARGGGGGGAGGWRGGRGDGPSR